jgi:multidrug efflux system membrane fusion protein
MTRFAPLALLLLAGCSQPSGPPPRPPAPVTVAAAAEKDVPVQVKVIGNVQPITSVTVRSLVGGELIAVRFQEGQEVKKGDLLFEIDPRPFEEAVRQIEGTLGRDEAQAKQAEANIARNSAALKQAQADAQRYADLFQQGVISQQLADQSRSSALALEAQVRADRASLENAQAAIRADRAALDKARLDLSFCTIRSPLDGRSGSLMVQQGNLVRANDTALVVINQLQPIYVAFAAPERYLSEIKRLSPGGRLRTEALLPQEEDRPETGVLTFVDNAVDNATGAIRLKSTFDNRARRLWPGQFVNVVLTLTSRAGAVVVPAQAVQTGQRGQFVFVVKGDQTAEARPVTAGMTVAGETVIEKGLAAGERVVTDGHLRVVPNGKVDIRQPGGGP